MCFIHRSYQKGETIAAIATPPGEGSVAIVRISGDQAIEVAAQIYTGQIHKYGSHTVHRGQILGREGEVIDEVLVVVMRAPRSYTGEETVEIQCHGSGLIAKRILERTLDAGARAALPGEFTFKAYRNGRIDLAQAESVQELIAAKNDLALSAAESRLRGSLSEKIAAFQKELFDVAAVLEAWVDFPEEGLEFASIEEVVEQLEACRRKMVALSDTFYEGKIVHEGLQLALIGSPNVGKSSLMNALLGSERAIVTAVAGTTRDLLEAELRLGGLHCKLLDTAGIRKTEEEIEQEGIRRSRMAMEEADLILLVLDSQKGVTDPALLAAAPEEKRVVIWNKVDLPSMHEMPVGAVAVSAKERQGLEALREAIAKKIWRTGPPSKEEVVLTSARHKQALDAAVGSIAQLIRGLQKGLSPEFLSSDMRQALRELGTIVGVDVPEGVLSAIFSKFCVGK